jgi:hypothetical protein
MLLLSLYFRKNMTFLNIDLLRTCQKVFSVSFETVGFDKSLFVSDIL